VGLLWPQFRAVPRLECMISLTSPPGAEKTSGDVELARDMATAPGRGWEPSVARGQLSGGGGI
jgi:hypothetical protein